MNDPEPSTQEKASPDLDLPGMPAGSVRPAQSPQRVIRRKAILSDAPAKIESAEPPARPSSLTYTTSQAGGPGANQRRNKHTIKLILAVVLANNLLIAAGVYWFVSSFFGVIESHLQGPVTAHPAAPPAAVISAPTANAINMEALEKQNATLESKFTQQINDLRKQLVESSVKGEASQKQYETTQQKLEEITRRVAGIAVEVKEGVPVHEAAPTAPTASSNANALDLPPSQSELVLLKERNRLTGYADEAIATGSREPYEELWKAVNDPRMVNLVHAARAEILRVQECYLSGQRAKYYGIQQYQIPIADIFPDAASLTPAQLSDDQLIQILEDKKVPWQARVKAAWYLGRHRTTKVGEALVKAVKEDPMLDVAAEATFSFEQVTGYRSKLFEPDNLEAWWKSYNATPPPNAPPKSKNKPAEAKEEPAPDSPSEAKPPMPAETKESKTPPAEDKTAKPEDVKDKDKPAIEPKLMPPPDKKPPLKSDSDKPEKKKGKKEKPPVIPLREPDEKQ